LDTTQSFCGLGSDRDLAMKFERHDARYFIADLPHASYDVLRTSRKEDKGQ
jgi:hypothetical protein